MKKVADRLLNRNGTFYYLRRVPRDLVPIIGKQHIKVSLRTKSKAEAKKLRTIMDLETDAHFAQCKPLSSAPGEKASVPPPKLTVENLIEYVRSTVEAEDAKAAKAYAANPPHSLDQLEDMRAEAEMALHALADPDHPDRQQLVTAHKKPFLDWAGVDKGADMPPEFAEFVRRAIVELYRRKMDRYDDRHNHTFHDKLFAPEPPPSVTLKKLADTFLKEKEAEWALNGVSESRSDKVRAIVAVLLEIVGPDMPVGLIDDELVWKVRSSLARVPANRKKLYSDLPLEKAIARGEKEGRKLLSATTQGTYLDTFRDILKLGVRRKLIPFNPAEGAKPLKKNPLSQEERRLPFSADQLKGFFTGSFYQSCAPKVAEPYSKPDRDWRFWFPLIMLLSGARPNEIAQLKVSNVRLSPGKTRYLDLMAEGAGPDAIKVKTTSSRRRVPIHSELVRIGFLKFVETRRKADGAEALLFPTLKPNKYDNRAWYPVKRFREKFLPAEIKVGKRRSLYSLRHNVRDALRQINAPPEALRAIAGWSPGGKAASDHYGDPTNPDLYTSWVEGIAYPGLDLSFLHR